MINQNVSEIDIFNGVTSFQELNINGGNQMPKNEKITDDFTDEDKVQGATLDFWKPKDEKSIIGLFVEWAKDNYGEHVVLNTGEEVVHLPNLMALNSKIKSKEPKEGDKVKIVYLGEKKAKSGRLYEDFDVFVKSSD